LSVGSTSNGAPLLISGSRDRNAIVWKLDLENPTEISEEGKVLDREVGKPYKALHGHNHFVSCVKLVPSNNYFFSGSWDKTVRLWDLNKFKTFKRFDGHTKDVLSLELTYGDRLLVSGSMDNTARIWDLSAKLQHTIEEFGGWVSSIKKIPNGKDSSLAIGSWDNSVGVFDSEYSRNRVISNYDNAVTCMDVDSTGNYLFVGSKNGVINLWELSEQEETREKKRIDTGATLNAVSYVDKWVQYVFAGTQKGFGIYDLTTGKAIQEYSFNNNKASCLSIAWDASHNYIFTGFSDGTIRVFKSTEGK
jgi:guanine nucleotide-binding protein subunit beta-2-like 1 protein